MCLEICAQTQLPTRSLASCSLCNKYPTKSLSAAIECLGAPTVVSAVSSSPSPCKESQSVGSLGRSLHLLRERGCPLLCVLINSLASSVQVRPWFLPAFSLYAASEIQHWARYVGFPGNSGKQAPKSRLPRANIVPFLIPFPKEVDLILMHIKERDGGPLNGI